MAQAWHGLVRTIDAASTDSLMIVPTSPATFRPRDEAEALGEASMPD